MTIKTPNWADVPPISRINLVLWGVVAAYSGLSILTVVFFAPSPADVAVLLVQTALYYAGYLSDLVVLLIVNILILRLAYGAVVAGPERLVQWYFSFLNPSPIQKHRLIDLVAATMLAAGCMTIFAIMKHMIPIIQPFYLDPAFAAWDQWLHFGQAPWTLTFAISKSSIALKLFDFFYTIWFALLLWSVCFVGIDRRHLRTRLTYLLTFVLTWSLLGNVLAATLSSAGPVYFEALGHGGDFRPLMDQLHATAAGQSITALNLQTELWRLHQATTPINAISAMPSMHVSGAVLLALGGYRYHLWLGHSLSAYAVIIFIGSVALGWHYAVDGYVAAAATLLIWKAAAHLSNIILPDP